jgi:hypothetical protein
MPALHLGAYLCVPILTSIFENGIASDFFVAFPPHQLRSVRHGINSVGPSVSELSCSFFLNEASSQAETSIPFKMTEEIFEVAGFKRNISVEIADKIESGVVQQLYTLPESEDLQPEAAARRPRYTQKPYETVLFGVRLNDLIGLIARIVAYDDPPLRLGSLREDAENRLLDE